MNFVTYQTYPDLPPESLLGSLLELLTEVFGNQSRAEWLTDLEQKAITYPAFQTLLALDGKRVVGCKLGYALSADTFYSWLGGVNAAYRGQGIAGMLMQQQHAACQAAGYVTIRTHTYNQWRNMLILNVRHGFDIVGTQPGKRGLTIFLEKSLR